MSRIRLPQLQLSPVPGLAIYALSKATLPALSLAAPRGISCDIPQSALKRWNSTLAAKDEDNTISIYDPIGSDFWGEGVTVKRIAAALRAIGKDKPVVVNVNSPGGDVFEGIAIYNTLRAHEGEVTVRVLGLAASAASLIAMAGDKIEIGRAAFMMMHNVWVLAMGNRHDLRDAADLLEPFDVALGAVYSARSGLGKEEVAALMDNETWFGGEEAIEKGFADDLLPADQIEESKDAKALVAGDVRVLDIALAKYGMPRSERRALLNRYSGTPNAAATQDRDKQNADLEATQNAGQEADVVAAREVIDRISARVRTL